MESRLKNIFIIFLIISCICLNINGKNTKINEHKLKAVFIYNFLKFVYWDENTKSKDYKVLVLGNNEVYESLSEISKDFKFNDKKLKIFNENKMENSLDVNILFISEDYCRKYLEIMEKRNLNKALIVTDCQSLIGKGVCFLLYKENNKMRIKVDLEALDKKNIKVSSHLLKLASIYKKGSF